MHQRHARRPGVRRRAAVALPTSVRRRVPGREPTPVRTARGMAGRALGRLRRRRSAPVDLRLERCGSHAARHPRRALAGARDDPPRPHPSLHAADHGCGSQCHRSGGPPRPPPEVDRFRRPAGPASGAPRRGRRGDLGRDGHPPSPGTRCTVVVVRRPRPDPRAGPGVGTRSGRGRRPRPHPTAVHAHQRPGRPTRAVPTRARRPTAAHGPGRGRLGRRPRDRGGERALRHRRGASRGRAIGDRRRLRRLGLRAAVGSWRIHRRRDPVHHPRRQGTRVADRAHRRVRGGFDPARVRTPAQRTRGRGAPALRRSDQSGARGAPSLGPDTHDQGNRPRPRAQPVPRPFRRRRARPRRRGQPRPAFAPRRTAFGCRYRDTPRPAPRRVAGMARRSGSRRTDRTPGRARR